MKIFNTLFAVIFALTGCAKTSSDNIKTSGFYAGYSVTGNNSNSVNCQANFQVSSGGTYIDLSSGDTVTCNGTSMSRSEFAGIITYSATVPYSVGSTYTITLTRSGESPYSATVTLPAEITVTSPSAGATITKGTAVSANWTASANTEDLLNVSWKGTPQDNPSPCPYDTTKSSGPPEAGTLGWSTSETQGQQIGVTGTCSVTLSYVRYRYGTMPTGLSGKIQATQQTSVSFNLVD